MTLSCYNGQELTNIKTLGIMIHNEHLRKADELYEIRHDNNGNAIHVYIKDGDAIIFQSLDDFIQYVYLGKNVSRIYVDENKLADLYEAKDYKFSSFKL